MERAISCSARLPKVHKDTLCHAGRSLRWAFFVQGNCHLHAPFCRKRHRFIQLREDSVTVIHTVACCFGSLWWSRMTCLFWWVESITAQIILRWAGLCHTSPSPSYYTTLHNPRCPWTHRTSASYLKHPLNNPLVGCIADWSFKG